MRPHITSQWEVAGREKWEARSGSASLAVVVKPAGSRDLDDDALLPARNQQASISRPQGGSCCCTVSFQCASNCLEIRSAIFPDRLNRNLRLCFRTGITWRQRRGGARAPESRS